LTLQYLEMKRLWLLFLFISLSIITNAQKEGNGRIVVHSTDTVNLYKRVKFAFINMDFIVKDLESDTIKTYPREFLNNDFLIATAIIKGQDVILSGIWGSRKLSILGYSLSPKDYNRVHYYKGSVEWKILRLVAEKIGGELKFED